MIPSILIAARGLSASTNWDVKTALRAVRFMALQRSTCRNKYMTVRVSKCLPLGTVNDTDGIDDNNDNNDSNVSNDNRDVNCLTDSDDLRLTAIYLT